MTERFLTITLQPDWQAGLRAAAQTAQKATYLGEVLNFESPGHFFGQLTEKRWSLVRTAQGKGELSVHELARLVERDVKRVHTQAALLFAQPGLEDTLRFEQRHQAIIERFGRYPHRNAILGRESTPEELAFLKEPGSGF